MPPLNHQNMLKYRGGGGSIMKRSKRVMLYVFVAVFITFVGGFLWLKTNAPMVAAISGSSSENQILLVQVGNKSHLANIHIEEVLVNNDETPENVKVQVSNALKGFIIWSNFEGKKEIEYNFTDLTAVELKTETDPQEQADKINKGTATVKDTIYAITINNDNKVQKVIIKYRYLGLKFKKVIHNTISPLPNE